ncbi:hypothetical protein RB213_006562, partial [Colletotrichum asianum]
KSPKLFASHRAVETVGILTDVVSRRKRHPVDASRCQRSLCRQVATMMATRFVGLAGHCLPPSAWILDLHPHCLPKSVNALPSPLFVSWMHVRVRQNMVRSLQRCEKKRGNIQINPVKSYANIPMSNSR